MSVHLRLNARMKEYYEQITQIKLLRRTPVAIRIDGKSFHSFTKGFNKPFDAILVSSMQETAKKLCENIQGAVLAYTQSDEITIILQDYNYLETDAWFNYEVQKLCSIVGSMATLYFNQIFSHKVIENDLPQFPEDNICGTVNPPARARINAANKGALFDARCFNIPFEEVTNLILWRQQDAIRNSIQSLGQFYFSPQQLNKKNQEDIKAMLLSVHGVNWEELEPHLQRGSCIIRDCHGNWIIDYNIPVFKDSGRDYIEAWIRRPE